MMDIKELSISIFDSFNARALTPKQVAKKFVPPDCFKKLIRLSNTLLVGPRGSGKTTLLKMLQAEALENWDSIKSEGYRKQVDFIGVFVSTDIMWSKQLNSLDDETFQQNHRGLLARSAFIAHVMHSLVIAMDYRTSASKDGIITEFKRVDIEQKTESEIVQEIAELWKINTKILSFDSLKRALSKRINRVYEIAIEEKIIGADGRNLRLASHNFLHIDFIHSIEAAIEIFEDLSNLSNEKWVLLIDELELAPELIRKELIDALRSDNQHLLFKLSLCPYSPDLITFSDEFSAKANNDYEPIRLWYPKKEEGYQFCNNLLLSMLEQRNLTDTSPEDIFGYSTFDHSNKYELDSEKTKAIRNLCKIDKSFKSYLEKHKIDLNDLEGLSDDVMASIIRKPSPIIILRESLLTLDKENDKLKIRTRKKLEVYSGVYSLYAVAEGNPRLFGILMADLLDHYIETKKTIPPNFQYSKILEAIEKFRALLKTIPCSLDTTDSKPLNLVQLLEFIGCYFRDLLLSQDFSPEYRGSFKTKESTPQNILNVLGVAINAGAIIYVPKDSEEFVINSLPENKRFRLSHLLAPHYRLPLTLGKSVSLNSILKKYKKEMPEKHLPLFDGEVDCD